MKKKTTIIAAALAVAVMLSFSFTNPALAQEESSRIAARKSPAFSLSIDYAGLYAGQPFFKMKFENLGMKRPVILIKDASNEVIYSEKLNADAARKTYQMNTPDINDLLTFELYDGGKKVYSKTFRISQETEVKTDVREIF
jgi:opacity protein-like surface antigen